MASKKSAAVEANDKARADLAVELNSEGYTPVVGGKNLKMEIGQILEGRLVSDPVMYKAGKSQAFDIEVEMGDGETETVTYWAQTILANLLKKLKSGDMVYIKRLDDIPTSNGDACDFMVAKKGR